MLGKQLKLFFSISICGLIVAIVMATWGFPKIVGIQIQKSVQLDNNSMMFEKWRKVPMPIMFKVYLFNVTNVDEVNKGGSPMLNEIGPYVYRQYREKRILGYGPNDTIKYMLKKTYIFDEAATAPLREDDLLTVINFPYMAAIIGVQRIMPALVDAINKALGKFIPNLVDPFMRVKVKDLLFDGVFLNCTEEGDDDALGLICGKVKLDKRPTMRPSEDGNGYYFSMFSHLNRTEAGPFEVVRGTENLQELGHIVSYKEQRVMKQWGDPYCGMINGSDGTVFPPIDESNVPPVIYTFHEDLCRSMVVEFIEKRTIFNMTGYFYDVTPMTLAGKSANPANKCYCRENWSANHDGCLLMGVMDLMPCQGAPAVVSFPHFYLASEELLQFFRGGISPNKTKHSAYLYLEPKTGVILKGVQRLQFNIELRSTKDAPQLANVPTGLFPLLWLEEAAELNQELQDELRHSYTLFSYVEAVRWILLAVAVAACAVSAIALARTGLWPRKNTVSFILRTGNASMDASKFN